MRRYLSLGSALVLGVVAGKTKTYEFENSHKTVEVAKNFEGDEVKFELQHFKQPANHLVPDFENHHEQNQRVRGRRYQDIDDDDRHGRDTLSVKEEPIIAENCYDFRYLPEVANYYHRFKYVYNVNVQYCNVGLHQMAVCTNGYYIGYCWYDGSEWEWQNFMEPDGTPDQSELTSVDTDYIYYTSPSDDISYLSEYTDYRFLHQNIYYNCYWPYGPYCYRRAVLDHQALDQKDIYDDLTSRTQSHLTSQDSHSVNSLTSQSASSHTSQSVETHSSHGSLTSDNTSVHSESVDTISSHSEAEKECSSVDPKDKKQVKITYNQSKKVKLGSRAAPSLRKLFNEDNRQVVLKFTDDLPVVSPYDS